MFRSFLPSQFEWAWQHPERSRRLKGVSGKSRAETPYEFRLRIVATMLRLGPWCQLPLTIRWLIQDYKRDFHPALQPPIHMAIAHGPVNAVNKLPANANQRAVKSAEPGVDGAERGDEDDDGVVVMTTKSHRCSVCHKRMVRR